MADPQNKMQNPQDVEIRESLVASGFELSPTENLNPVSSITNFLQNEDNAQSPQ